MLFIFLSDEDLRGAKIVRADGSDFTGPCAGAWAEMSRQEFADAKLVDLAERCLTPAASAMKELTREQLGLSYAGKPAA